MANTITVNVTPVNDAPAGADNTVTTNEDTTYTFAAADFGFSDTHDSPANTLAAVKITTLPGAGVLMYDGIPLTLSPTLFPYTTLFRSLKFSPATDANGTGYASFTFQ